MKISNSQGSYSIDDDEIVTDSCGDRDCCNDIAAQYVADIDEENGRYADDVEADFQRICNTALAKAQAHEEYTFGQWDAWCSEASV